MYVHQETGLAYLAHPRTASVATGQALQHQAGFTQVAGHHGHTDHDGPAFTAVRNHWDAVVSWHCGGHGDPGPLTPERCEEIIGGASGYLPRPDQLWGLFRPRADIVIRYEGLDGSLNRVLTGFGVPAVELPDRNVSTGRRGRPYRAFYDDPSRKWVADRFADEIDELGYTF